MTLVQGGLDSPLITEDNSSGIIQESTPQSVELPKDLPEIQLISEPVGEQSPEFMPRSGLNVLQPEAEKVVEQFNFNEKTSLWDSISASAKQFDFVGAYDQYKLESKIRDNEAGLYTPDPDYNIQQSLDSVDIPLSKDEVQWLHGKDITSAKAFDLYIESIKEDRELQKVAGVNPKTSLLTSFFDPTYIVAGGAVAKGASMLRLGKFATTGIVGASEYGVTTAQEYHRPVSTLELVASTALPMAITMALYRKPVAKQSLNGSSETSDIVELGKAKIANVEHDPVSNAGTLKMGAVETIDTIDNIDAINASRNAPLGKNPQLVEPAIKVDAQGVGIPPKLNKEGFAHSSEINWKQPNSKGVPIENTAYRYLYNAIEDTRIPQSIRDMSKRLLLQGGKDLTEMPVEQIAKLKQAGRYYPSKNKIQVRKGTSASTLNHEVVHGLTSIKIHYGKQNPNSVHGELVREIEELREFVKSHYDQSRKSNPKEFSIREQQEISYALKDPEEFLAGLYEGDTAFKKLLENIETPNNLKKGSEKSLLQSLYTGLRRLLGFTVEEATAFNRAMKLSDDLIDAPKIQYTDVNGKLHEFKASEVTPELINAKASEEAQALYKKLGGMFEWNLSATMAKFHEGFARGVLSNPIQGEMTSNVVSRKRELSARLSIARKDAETLINAELSKRGVSRTDRVASTDKYKQTIWDIEGEVALYVERRSQAEAKGITLPRENTPIANIAEKYNEMTREAKELGLNANIFPMDVSKVNWYLPRKIDSSKYAQIMQHFERLYGDQATTKFVDALSATLNLGSDAKYTRHIAYIYYRRMHSRYVHTSDSFRSHLGNEVVSDVRGYLDELGASSLEKDYIEKLLTGSIDKRGEASFQKARLDIDTLKEITLPDGSTFKFYDLMDTKVMDIYSRYGDNVAGRVALAEEGLGTPTLWNKLKDEVLSEQSLMKDEAKRDEVGAIIDDIYSDILGYPVGEKLNPFLQGMRAFNQSVALKNSGVWQPMETIPVIRRHGKTLGYGQTLSTIGKALFTSLKNMEKTDVNRLHTYLARVAMDDLKISPMSARQADNYDLNQHTFSAKLMQLSKYTYVVNGMRYVMSKQSIASAKLIVSEIEGAVKGSPKSIGLLKKFGMTDADISELGKQMSKYGDDWRSWDLSAKNELLPKLVNLMDTDVLRSRLGEIPAFMQFSSVGKVLGTFRNFTFTAHNKLFSSTLKDEGILAVAIVTAMQLPTAMLAVQVANLQTGKDLIEDPLELLSKAIAQTGVLGLASEVAGIFTKETTGIGSPFTFGLDKIIRTGNTLASGDFYKTLETGVGAIPLVSVTLGVNAGINALVETLKED